ncbi:Ig-like domain-containing protein [Ectothiorhodospiraceae bacterium WFHF3C12]|nr:Ig-like domain-containing protein [Ectothiorhodospiraceae bacterium WFHF3C12]
MRQIAATLAATLLLIGCGGGNSDGADGVDFSSWKDSALVSTYPRDGQTEVPASAPVALRFSHALTTPDPVSEVTLETASGQAVAFTPKTFDGGRGILISPDAPLAPNTRYVVDIGRQSTEYGAVQTPEGGLQFTTRAGKEGATDTLTSAPAFQVARLIPDGSLLPLMDFSSLRLQFTQPIDRTSLRYAVVNDVPDGGSIALVDDAGELVAAHVLASGPYLTLDPEQPLSPGDEYTLQLDDSLRSTLGNNLEPAGYDGFTFTPGDSRPREVLIQQADVSNPRPGRRCGPDTTGDTLSPLTGMPVNCVPLQAMLLGQSTSVQQQGVLAAELAFPPNYPEVTPFRVPRGTLLNAASVEVLIAGAAPTGYDSGEVSVTFLSDAVGYLLPNPYSDDKTAPKQVRLFMDIAMTTSNPRANGGLSQDLLHVELVGSGIVRDGRLVIDAVGMVEPRILGQEYGRGLISFQMASFPDQEAAPAPAPDTRLPSVQSWLPGEDGAGHSRAGEMRPGDPIIVNLSEPVEPQSVVAGESVLLNGGGDFAVRVNGATLVLDPQPDLEFGQTYTVNLTADVTDLAGNPLDQSYALSFRIPHHVDGPARAPLATTTYPGYPCVTIGRDIANGDHGRCAGGQNSDDHLPVTTLPANRAIEVQFSQTMDPASIELGGSFVVEANTQPDGSGTWSEVPGRLEVGKRVLRFHPETAWAEGRLYRYVLGSNGGGSAAAGDCGGSDAICSAAGHPLQTRMLAQSADFAPEPTHGGPDMTLYFHGAPSTDSVLQTFRNLPTVDVNANFVHDGRTVSDDESTCTRESCEALPAMEAGEYVVEENASNIIATGAGGLAEGANTGCGFNDDGSPASCPARQFVWLTAGLNSEVLGTGTHPGTGREAVRVAVHPNIIYTSNLDVYADVSILPDPVLTPSGPQIMRVRYAEGPEGRPQPMAGWIYENDDGVPTFEVQAELYLDAPYLEPLLSLPHNLHSYELSMTLRGPVTFTRDGRMQVRLRNDADVPIDVSLGANDDIEIDLQIPAGGTSLVFTQPAIKQ